MEISECLFKITEKYGMRYIVINRINIIFLMKHVIEHKQEGLFKKNMDDVKDKLSISHLACMWL